MLSTAKLAASKHSTKRLIGKRRTGSMFISRYSIKQSAKSKAIHYFRTTQSRGKSVELGRCSVSVLIEYCRIDCRISNEPGSIRYCLLDSVFWMSNRTYSIGAMLSHKMLLIKSAIDPKSVERLRTPRKKDTFNCFPLFLSRICLDSSAKLANCATKQCTFSLSKKVSLGWILSSG